MWTTLPPKSFFVHPGPNGPVAVAWTSPLDGEIALEGRVADAHPAGGDGVAFQLDHLAAPAIGQALVDIALKGIGEAALELPDPGPAPLVPVAYAVADSEAKNARLHVRGDPEKLGEEIPRRWLTVFGGEPVGAAGSGREQVGAASSGREELAEWVASHPLAARVMVNRLWEWHFGRGLVTTSNDFGARGEKPSHPELLDWLAGQFVASGYSVKAMHRMILRTQAWRRASAAPHIRDPENRSFAHFTRRRLTAEELRDSLLAASGRLDLSAGEAHPFPAENSWTFTQHAPFAAVYETNRRSAFLMAQRQRRHPFLALFDGADPNASTPARQTTTVPTQALYFINDPFFHEQAAAFAASVIDQPDDEARLRRAFQVLFQRDPSDAEQTRLLTFLDRYPGERLDRWSALARVLLASNEFLHVE